MLLLPIPTKHLSNYFLCSAESRTDRRCACDLSVHNTSPLSPVGPWKRARATNLRRKNKEKTMEMCACVKAVLCGCLLKHVCVLMDLCACTFLQDPHMVKCLPAHEAREGKHYPLHRHQRTSSSFCSPGHAGVESEHFEEIPSDLLL